MTMTIDDDYDKRLIQQFIIFHFSFVRSQITDHCSLFIAIITKIMKVYCVTNDVLG